MLPNYIPKYLQQLFLQPLARIRAVSVMTMITEIAKPTFNIY